ncbi:MAG TPA: ATP-dependent helicase HrpB [Steroidobacteraceae bacterium]|nr:ATP-dependent helicase HrpB [Steroidobacteraceae bacterium]HNS26728.1 ATP-dependent helicase HrpB [Steroidobacteraceae bacterium]
MSYAPPAELPVTEVLPALRAALREQRSAILQAPPGAGKSTVVPLALLAEPWLAGRKLLVLEPRRLAARAVAERMAASLGERVGEQVGYRMRLETRVSRATRIEVITEGVLTRRLQHDPALEDTAAVLFDEFHERSLHADLGLALTLEARAALRADLRIVVMSATLDGEAVAKLIGAAPIVTAQGRQFAVETRYLRSGLPVLPGEADSPERLTSLAVLRALREETGDILVFLPGAGEIRRVAATLEASTGADVDIRALYGELTGEAQLAALAPAGDGRRRIVLATNLAETSLTIPGVRVVVDSGLVRRAIFDPASGMGRLETRRISRASADQRQGRAGRTAPGVCYRLWGEGAHRSLAAYTPAEILEADLAPLALELAVWGAQDAAQLAWLDPPPAAQLASARDLLRWLGALDREHRVTAHGRAMADLPVHPRLAHMLLRSRGLQATALAADIAALLGERDLLRGAGRDADLRTRLEALRDRGHGAQDVDRGALERVRRAAQQLRTQIGAGGHAGAAGGAGDSSDVEPGELLALAYPDRIGRRRGEGEGRYALANGRGAQFTRPDTVSGSEFIAIAAIDDAARDARIRLAAPLSRAALEALFTDAIETRDVVEWDARTEAVIARRLRTLGALTLDERALRELPAGAAEAAMLAGVVSLGLDALPWTAAARGLQQRVAFVRAHVPDPAEWPDLGDAALAAHLGEWLAPWLGGITRRAHLARLPMSEILGAQLTHAQRAALSRLAPTHLTMPTGSTLPVDYTDPASPTVAVRLQEVFGLAATPRIADGALPVTFTLLSPARRPVQVTRDLESFWRSGYAEVRKDLRGRYPRHYWPENPLEAEPTRGVKRRR